MMKPASDLYRQAPSSHQKLRSKLSQQRLEPEPTLPLFQRTPRTKKSGQPHQFARGTWQRL